MTSNVNHFGLKKLSINAASWTFFGYGVSLAFRLLSSLILARLLAPEHFGLIAIVTVFMTALAMFSDVGIGTNIIQSKRGEEEDFLNTAWTIQIIRGFLLWFICLVLAWPMSIFYNQPDLVLLIPVSGLVAIIGGFNSTGIYSNERSVNLKNQTIYDLISQIAAFFLMAAIAFIHASVWVLVAGSLFAALLRMLLSHRLVPMGNRFCWDQDAVKSLVTFGRWILISTMLGFFINSGSNLILGKFLSMSDLGIFSIGVTLAKVVEQIYYQIISRVLIPVYAKIKHLNNAEIKSRVFKLKLVIMAVFLPPLWILVIFAHEIVALIFDTRYQDAGWILQIFALGFIPTIISGLASFYLAYGDTVFLMRMTLVKALLYFLCVYIGWLINGANGIIYGMAASNSILYFVDAYAQKRHSVWLLKLDILGFVISAIVITFGFYLKFDTLIIKNIF